MSSENVGVLFKDVKGRWRFRVEARNGEILAQSEAYVRRIDALQTLLRLGVDEVDVKDLDA